MIPAGTLIPDVLPAASATLGTLLGPLGAGLLLAVAGAFVFLVAAAYACARDPDVRVPLRPRSDPHRAAAFAREGAS